MHSWEASDGSKVQANLARLFDEPAAKPAARGPGPCKALEHSASLTSCRTSRSLAACPCFTEEETEAQAGKAGPKRDSQPGGGGGGPGFRQRRL